MLELETLLHEIVHADETPLFSIDLDGHDFQRRAGLTPKEIAEKALKEIESTTHNQCRLRIGRYTLEVLEFENGLKEVAIQRESGEYGLFNYTKLEDTIDMFFEENF